MADISAQWQKLTREEFDRPDAAFIDRFRAPGSANKFVAWDPFERSSRYFKFLLFNTVMRQSPRFFEAYAALRNREVGNPLTVRCHGLDIDADYFAAVEEWEFLTDAGALTGVHTVVEIGAGFGRTCHTLLTLCPGIERYVIVDLPPMLGLSRAYLQRVAAGAPVEFVSNDDRTAIRSLSPDLAINIDSFQEMPPAVIDAYMTDLVGRSPRFYCKNPVGKYLPATVGLGDPGPERLMDVFSLGYRREVVDLFDDRALAAARTALIEAYRPPASGGTYAVAADKPMDLFPYFHHILYTR